MAKRVLIVNKFYYSRGGDCVCTLNLETLLKSKGYQVMMYAMDYSENIATDDAKYFASNVDFGGSITQKVNALKRIFGFGDIVPSFKRVLDEFKPDIVHLQNIHSYLSPIVAKLAKRQGCKVVWTLHDYKLLCPSYSCLNNSKACELCFSNKINVLKHKCMKNSALASIIAYIESIKWSRRVLEKHVDSFVCPSQFMKNKMEQGGFDLSKLHVICNFIDPLKATVLDEITVSKRDNYYVYVGRLSEEKGVRTLLSVAKTLPYTLKIAGGGLIAEELKAQYSKNDNIQFLGHLDAKAVSDLVANAKFLVVPSECYENNPLSVIESLYAGTPVVGAGIGGIPELINAKNGIIYTPGDCAELSEALKKAFCEVWDYDFIKRTARIDFTSERYFRLILKLYL